MSHLTYEERIRIETLLNENRSIKSIAKVLERPASTISREIKRHITIVPRKTTNDCKNQYGCSIRHLCSGSCNLKCRLCARCIKYCKNYEPDICDGIVNAPYVCNACSVDRCLREKHYYKAKVAQETYSSLLVDTRSGFNITVEELQKIDNTISPLIKQGLSPYHIAQTIKNELPYSESTIYRLVSSAKISARDIDLINKVKRKPRNKPNYRKMKQEFEAISKKGHRYSDFLAFQLENDFPVVQMDCVEGSKDDSAVLLTLHFVNSHMQLAIIMDNHDANHVVAALDKLETTLGTNLFSVVFPLILTDNGPEFLKREEMERSCLEQGRKRTIIFYCEPNRSDEKGQCEKNHTHIRYVIPKGHSMEPFTQADISLMMNHINSYYRRSLMGKSPYEVAMSMLPEDFFLLLGLEIIPPEKIILKPSLLKNSK